MYAAPLNQRKGTMISNSPWQIYLLMVYVIINTAISASTFSCNNTQNVCILSGSEVTCTCTVEDESGRSVTLWDGSAFTSQCPGSLDQIILAHLLFTGRQRIVCGDRISAVPVSQELNNFTSNATITASTSNNGSSLTCSAGGPPLVGVMILSVGEIPPAPSNLSIPLQSLSRGRFSLTWTEPINVFGGVGSYLITARSDQMGDVTRLCGHITAPNGGSAPLRDFTDWVAEGQICYFNVKTVTGNNCNFISTPSLEVAITLPGPNQAIVEQIILKSPVYVNNQLRVVDISFIYLQGPPVVIVNGVTSVTTQFSITYSYSDSGSCTTIVPLSCDQQRWCNYTLTLDNCPTTISGNGVFSIIPLNIIGTGTTRNSDLIANRNPLFEVSLSNQSNINSPSKRLQLRFQATFTVAQCFFKYEPVTSTDCTRTNLNLNETIVSASTDSDVIIINVTLSQSGTYCYRITCTTMPNPMPRLMPIAQGMLEYQHIYVVPTEANGDSFPLWVVAVIIIIAVILAITVIVVITLAVVRKIKSEEIQEHHDQRGMKEVSGMPEYEEVATQPAAHSETFEMGENAAYGPVLNQNVAYGPVLNNRAS